MVEVTTYSMPSTAFGIQNTDFQSDICIAGICYDLGTSNRSGTRFGPAAIRAASRMLADGDHPAHWVNPLDQKIADIGNFSIVPGDVVATMAQIQLQASLIDHLISLGGDHSISLPLLRAVATKHGPVGLIHFDAHVDTWPDNFSGTPFGHGNPFYHAINEGLVDPKRMVQIGIRSPVNRDVYDWTTKQGVYIWTAEEVFAMGTDVDQIGDFIVDRMSGEQTKVYLTMDIDVLDPAFAPGTGTPEVGGLNTWQVQRILRQLVGLNFVGMDMVEVCPSYDVSEITALAAATFVWEYLALLKVGKTTDEIPF